MTVDEALNHNLVTVIQRNHQAGFYRITLGTLATEVFIRLKPKGGSGQTAFERSHDIKTPLQIGPYRTSISLYDTPGDAMRRAITGLTDHYEHAVKAGHSPEESWLCVRGG